MKQRWVLQFLISCLLIFPIATFANAILVKLHGTIDNSTTSLLEQVYQQAESKPSSLVIIQLSNEAAIAAEVSKIANLIGNATLPTVVYIPNNRSITSASSGIMYNAALTAMGKNSTWHEPQYPNNSRATSTSQALKQGVIDLKANSISDLIQQLEGRTVNWNNKTFQLPKNIKLQRINASVPNQIKHFLDQPTYSYVILILAIWCLIIELTNPGLIVPGLLGIVGLCSGLYGLLTLPLNPIFAVLFCIGIALIILQGFKNYLFLFGITGTVLMALGSFWMINSPYLSNQLPVWLILLMCLSTLAVVWLIVHFSVKAHRRKSITGIDALIGVEATVETNYRGQQHILHEGVQWKIDPEDTYSVGTRVRVVGVKKNTLLITDQPSNTSKES